MQDFMITAPRGGPKDITKRELRILLEKFDIKRWIVAMEEGKSGYKHWQIRVRSSDPDFFAHWSAVEPRCKVLKANTGSDTSWTYERKEGRFWSSDDTPAIQQVRFGKLRPKQEEILRTLRTQSDRQIDVWLDPKGNHGKSWLTIHLWETGQALVVPRAACTAHALSAFICSAYKGEPIIVIDIPRSGKPTPDLYECMEEIKDGLVFDHRYHGQARNIRGVKLMVFTNNPLDSRALSKDRWRFHGHWE